MGEIIVLKFLNHISISVYTNIICDNPLIKHPCFQIKFIKNKKNRNILIDYKISDFEFTNSFLIVSRKQII